MTARQTTWIAGFFTGQPNFRQQLASARRGLFFRFAFDDHRPFNNVFQHRTMRKQIKVLEDKPDVLTQLADQRFLLT
ncbi:Uncharacterised protein [Shigella sonnei]|nr:Uncharacterised protein [Shigella sonnei]